MKVKFKEKESDQICQQLVNVNRIVVDNDVIRMDCDGVEFIIDFKSLRVKNQMIEINNEY